MKHAAAWTVPTCLHADQAKKVQYLRVHSYESVKQWRMIKGGGIVRRISRITCEKESKVRSLRTSIRIIPSPWHLLLLLEALCLILDFTSLVIFANHRARQEYSTVYLA